MSYTLFFDEATPADYPLLGGKGASLASMCVANFPVPLGFCITTNAYSAFLEESGLFDALMAGVGCIDCTDLAGLDAQSAQLRQQLLSAPLPEAVEAGIRLAYRQLCERVGTTDDLPVAVRSSATAEDLPDASFAGQQDTYLWVMGEREVVEHVRRCWASLYTARAINYRRDQNIPEREVLMSVVVQKMVNARTAGVTMTLNPTNGDRSKIAIDAAWGLGEAVVSGEVTPDHFLVDKVMLEILKADIHQKTTEHVPDRVNRRVQIREVESDRACLPSLTDGEVQAICRMAKTVEKHYRCPQDIEWALDADLPDGQNLMLLQSRPETVWSRKKVDTQTQLKTGMEGILNTLMNPIAGKQR
jgi:pyruvate, water dikinase